MNFKFDNREALDAKDAFVYKYGGDNAGDVFENCQALENKIEEYDDPKKIVLAISAIRNSDEIAYGGMRHKSVSFSEDDRSSQGFNTTNHLIAMGKALSGKTPDKALALEILDCIEAFTSNLVERNLEQDPEANTESILLGIKAQCGELRALINTPGIRVVDLGRDQVLALPDGTYRSISGFGEDIARDVYVRYLQDKKLIRVGKLKTEDLYNDAVADGYDLVDVKKTGTIRAEAESRVKSSVRERVLGQLEASDVVISGGHAPVLALEKGYSEKVAAVIAGVLQTEGLATAMCVEKKFPLLSIDPGLADKFKEKGVDISPRVLEKVDIGMAQNLFAETFGNAGAVQWGALVEAISNGVEIFVYNPEKMRSGDIARVCNIDSDYTGIENVTLRKDATHIGVDLIKNPNIENLTVLTVIGRVLARKKYETIASNFSKTKATVTINGSLALEDQEAIDRALERASENKDEPMRTEVNPNVSALIMMGRNMERAGTLHDITGALYGAGVNILEPGHTNDQEAIPLIIDKKQALLAAAAVHVFCVEQPNRLDGTREHKRSVVESTGMIEAAKQIEKESV